MYPRGFAISESLIVIAILSVMASVTFAVLNPVSHFREVRDVQRAADTLMIVDAIEKNNDRGGDFHRFLDDMKQGEVRMIGTRNGACDLYNPDCETLVTPGSTCVDVGELYMEGDMPYIPIAPKKLKHWDFEATGYTLSKNHQDLVVVRACEFESGEEIEAVQVPLVDSDDVEQEL